MPQERQKIRVGRVISGNTNQTVTVAVRWQQPHPLYRKSLRRTTKLYVHDKENKCKPGDLVRIQETRPISRTKHWRVIEIVERREVVEVKPIELNEGLLSEEREAKEAQALMTGDQTKDTTLEEGEGESEEPKPTLLDEGSTETTEPGGDSTKHEETVEEGNPE